MSTMTDDTRKREAAPQREADGRTGSAATTGRAPHRLRRMAGVIADQIIHQARPDAPTLEIVRIVGDRCQRAALPIPSRRSLVARIAYVRAYGAPGEGAYRHQITIDHCILADGDGTAATLSIAVLEPPGTIVAWQLSGRSADAAMAASLLADTHARAFGEEPARISALFGRDDGHAAIDAAFREAGIDRVGGSAARPLHGTTGRRLIGRTIAGMAVRMKPPSAPGWADEAWIERNAQRIASDVARRNIGRRAGTPFRIVRTYHAAGFVDALSSIRSADDDAG